jgi:phenylalanyl-tRNA synthetase beta subunit
VEDLRGAVRCAYNNRSRDFSLFYFFAGPGLEFGTSSLALAVRVLALHHTLPEAEIEAAVKKITAAAAKATGATLRA